MKMENIFLFTFNYTLLWFMFTSGELNRQVFCLVKVPALNGGKKVLTLNNFCAKIGVRDSLNISNNSQRNKSQEIFALDFAHFPFSFLHSLPKFRSSTFKERTSGTLLHLSHPLSLCLPAGYLVIQLRRDFF